MYTKEETYPQLAAAGLNPVFPSSRRRYGSPPSQKGMLHTAVLSLGSTKRYKKPFVVEHRHTHSTHSLAMSFSTHFHRFQKGLSQSRSRGWNWLSRLLSAKASVSPASGSKVTPMIFSLPTTTPGAKAHIGNYEEPPRKIPDWSRRLLEEYAGIPGPEVIPYITEFVRPEKNSLYSCGRQQR